MTVSSRAARDYLSDRRRVAADFYEIFDLYPAQHDFVRSTRRFNGFWGGRGTGKTFSLATAHLKGVLINDSCRSGLLSRSYRELGSVLLPEYRDKLRTWKDATGVDLVRTESKSLGSITHINDHMLEYRSWDRADRLRSHTWSHASIDELEKGSEDPAYAIKTVNACLRAPLAKLRQLNVGSTPDGMRGGVALFIDAQRNGSTMHAIQHATMFDNPHIDDEFRESVRLSMTEREWQQEGLGYILKPTSSAYVEYDESRHVVPYKWEPDRPWIMGVDWDPSGYICAIQVRPRKNPYGYQWVVAKEWRFSDVGPMDMRQAVEDVISTMGMPEIACVDRSPSVQRNWLQSKYRGDLWVKTNQDTQLVREGMRQVAFMLAPPRGKEPLLVFSDELESRPASQSGVMRIRDSMMTLSHKRDRFGNIMDEVERNTPPTHSTDTVRYCCVGTSAIPQFHGGAPLRAVFGDARLELVA